MKKLKRNANETLRNIRSVVQGITSAILDLTISFTGFISMGVLIK